MNLLYHHQKSCQYRPAVPHRTLDICKLYFSADLWYHQHIPSVSGVFLPWKDIPERNKYCKIGEYL